uniref:bromodomain adjacent to zinc finger domain protein 1A-like n=1 Tax=Myxine glutinosa TaxID=7769 RepID=UPI00358F9370
MELLQKQQLEEAREQLMQRKLEEKQQLKLLRDEKREKMREEKRLHAEKLREWRRPREDLECDDLQALPKPSPVCTPIPLNLFGDAIMLLEFLHGFGGFFHLKDEFPKGLNLGVLEDALMYSNPNGPLCDLLFFFLSAISAGQADEEEQERRNHLADHSAVTGLSEALEEVEQDSTKTAISSLASLAAAWPIFHQGCPLNKLELDSYTLSEILRLHVLASGAGIDLSNALFRYRQHGGYDTTDDPCIELRLKWPSLLRHLALFSVYDLRPEEKVRILHALCGQLLSLVTTREYIEESFEKLKQARQDLRELRNAGIRRQREEAAARFRKRKEQKLLEQQDRVNNVHPCEPVLESRSTAVERDLTFEQAESALVVSQQEHPDKTSDADKVMESNLLSPQSCKLACSQQAETANGGAEASATLPEKGTATKVGLADEEKLEQAQALQQLQAERDLQKRIWVSTARTNVAPLGRDRYYSRYWLFHSLHGLFVEHSGEYFEKQEVTTASTGAAADDDGDKAGVSTLPDEGSTTGGQDSADLEVKQGRDTSQSQSVVDMDSTWSVFHSPEQLDELLATLNPRGLREGALREALLQDLDRVRAKLKPERLRNLISNEQSPKCRTTAPGEDLAEGVLEQTLREYLLSLEERIWKGSVGRIKVVDRQTWRTALKNGGYNPQCAELHWGVSNQHKLTWNLSGEKVKVYGEGQSPSSDRLRDLKVEQCGGTGPSETNTTLHANTTVQDLALALLQVEQAVAHRFLTPPFGNAEKGKVGRKTKKKEDHKSVKREQDGVSSERDEGAKAAAQPRSLLNRWEESLVACTSLSQVFVHLSSLDRSILWEKSALNARCHLCGRKNDPGNMLLCDSCDRGHHLYCLQPRLKDVPEGDWFCPECRPKPRGRPSKKRQHFSQKNEGDENNEKRDALGTREKEERIKKENVKESPARVLDVDKPYLQQIKRQCHSPAEQVLPSSPMEGKVRRGRPPGSGRKALQCKPIKEKKRSKEPNSILSDDSLEKRHRRKGDKEETWRRSSTRHSGVHELSTCEKLAVELVRHEDSWPFLRPVLRSHVPDYYDIIKQPIALNMIREKLNSCHYQSASEFVRDIELMFSNCFAYNAMQMAEAQAGKRLQTYFHERVSPLGLLCRPPTSSPAVPDISNDDCPSSQSKCSRQ